MNLEDYKGEYVRMSEEEVNLLARQIVQGEVITSDRKPESFIFREFEGWREFMIKNKDFIKTNGIILIYRFKEEKKIKFIDEEDFIRVFTIIYGDPDSDEEDGIFYEESRRRNTKSIWW
jgi:hypothetical protein